MRNAECRLLTREPGGVKHWLSALVFSNFTFDATLLVLAFVSSSSQVARAATPEKVTFDDDVSPIFREHCMACHDQGGRSGDLSLESYADTLTGGAGGEVVEPGAGDSSRLYQLMAHVEKPIMPPGQDKLPEEQLQLVKAWIDGGLLENAGSKAKKSSKPAVAAFVPSADNRPPGEPAMPAGFFRQPVVYLAQSGAVADVACSPWAPLAAITGQRQVLLYHTDTLELLAVVPFVVGSPEVVRFSRNGELLLVAGGRGGAQGVSHLWEIKTGKRIAELGDELDTALAADISADHTLVALGGPRKRVQVIRTADSSLAYSITKHTDWVTALEMSPDGKHLATADRSGAIHLWQLSTGRPVATLAGHKAAITAISWRDDSQLLATASDDGDVRTWQPRGVQAKQWRTGSGVQDLAFTKNARLVTVGRDRKATLWDTNGKRLMQLGPTDDIALSVATTHDDKSIVFADWTGAVRIAKLDSGEELGLLNSNPPMLAMRLATAEQSLQMAVAELALAETDYTKSKAQFESAQGKIAAHQQAVDSSNKALAEATATRKKTLAVIEAHQTQLEMLTQAVAKTEQQEQAMQKQLADLRQQLASVGNQEGEDADGAAATAIEVAITEQETKLDETLAERKKVEAQKPSLVAQLDTTSKQLAESNATIKQHKTKLAELDKHESSQPTLDKLKVDRDRLLKEFERQQAAEARWSEQVQQLRTEIATYDKARDVTQAALAEQQQLLDRKSAELAKATDQFAQYQQQLTATTAELDKLKQHLATLEKEHRQLRKASQKSKQAADTLDQQVGEVSSQQQQTRRAASDLETAVELRQQLSTGD